MKIEEIKQKHPDQWVLARIIKENEIGEVEEAEPIFCSVKRDEVYDKIEEVEDGARVFTLYTGEILGEGEAFAFGVFVLD